MSDEKNNVDFTSRVHGAILGAFASDAFSLQYHWVYNTDDIKTPVEPQLGAPASKFHADKGKILGDLTHEGDLMLLMFRDVVDNGKFDTKSFATKFQELYNEETYKGWLTHAVKDVLQQLKEGKKTDAVGSEGNDDSSPLGRMAPLLAVARRAPAFKATMRRYVRFTHRGDLVLAAAEFLADTLFLILTDGKDPVTAIQEAAKMAPTSENEKLVKLIEDGLASKDDDTTEAIKRFGQACATDAGLPGAIHLIAKYSDNLEAADAANVAAGGDSSARGTICGMILGAHLGAHAVPSYVKDTNCWAELSKLIMQA